MKPVATSLFVLAALLLVALPGAATDRALHHLDGIPSRNGGGGGPFEPTFEAIQANVFTPTCALSFCHGEAQSANLDLREGVAYANLVGVPSLEVPSANRIEPFDPDASYLICKLENCSWIVGSQMPIIPGPLEQTVIDVIREWVLLGAPETSGVAVESFSWGRVKASYR
jgi:hypothetical protein